MKEAVTKIIDTLTQEDFHEALQGVVGTVQQVHWSRRRLLWRGLEFHVCTINKGAHTKKVWKLIVCTSYIYIYIYIYIIYKYIYSVGLMSAWFRSQLQVSSMSSHTDELWYNETVCPWMTIYIYSPIGGWALSRKNYRWPIA